MADRKRFLGVRILTYVIIIIFTVYIINLIILQINNRRFYQISETNSKDDVTHFIVPNTSSLQNKITIVTAYFNLGTISKGTEGNYITEKMFFRWAKAFSYMQNQLIVYTDCKEFYNHMDYVRKSKKDRTIVRLINRTSSWAFQNEPRIRKIISQKDYPKFLPNTVDSAYICTQHAKYDVIKRSAHDNPFKTKYFAWVDIGYFRNRTKLDEFYLATPPDFDTTRIAVNQVFRMNPNLKPEKIFKQNRVWIGGGLILGERGVIIQFADQFERAVDHYLKQGLVNTDQQTLYAMFTKSGMKDLKLGINVQLYRGPGKMDIERRWFYLGYSMIRDLTSTVNNIVKLTR